MDFHKFSGIFKLLAQNELYEWIVYSLNTKVTLEMGAK